MATINFTNEQITQHNELVKMLNESLIIREEKDHSISRQLVDIAFAPRNGSSPALAFEAWCEKQGFRCSESPDRLCWTVELCNTDKKLLELVDTKISFGDFLASLPNKKKKR